MPDYKTISEKLLLPIKTDCAVSGLTSYSPWSSRQEEKSQFLTIQTTKLVNKNLQKTSYPLFMSSHVDKWVKEVMPKNKIKAIQIKLFPTVRQKNLINEFINTSRYVYNRAVELIKKGNPPNFQNLRDLLVTENTKKGYPEYSILKDEISKVSDRSGMTGMDWRGEDSYSF